MSRKARTFSLSNSYEGWKIIGVSSLILQFQVRGREAEKEGCLRLRASRTLNDGISPLIILQKMQAAIVSDGLLRLIGLWMFFYQYK